MTAFDLLHPALQYHIVNSLGWRELRPAQEQTIQPILNGEDIMLLAPTAGGKTEAAVIPLFSRMLSASWSGLSVLYVCPIRALLNNLMPRLSRYGALMGRQVRLWHGDVTAGERKRILAAPPDMLLTTPESIEAMLVSTKVDHRALFANLQAVVIDEMHAFAGDDRGWHLQSVLSRLEHLAGRRLQRVGLSATVGNPEDLASWVVRAGNAPATIVQSVATMPMAPEVLIDHAGSLENAAVLISRLHRGEKRLVFCDSRARVEALAAGLRDFGVTTFVSHSSLGLAERQRAEAAFAEGSDCVIVATSTLELGLDVGDLDRVIQIDAPTTVASFLQRLGRTGRRPNTVRNCLFLTTEIDAFLQANALVRLWATGFVEPIIPPPKPWHLLGQQVLALALQEHGIPVDRIPDWLQGMAGFAPAFPGLLNDLMAFWVENAIVHVDQGRASIGQTGVERYGHRHFMDLLSAFTTPALFSVRYGKQELGEVHHASFQSAKGRPPVLLLGGRSWTVTAIDWPARVAWVEPSHDEGRSRWGGTSRALHAQMCRSIRAVLAHRDMDSYLSNRGKTLMAELVEEFSWVRADETALVRDGRGGSEWWTFAGALANRTIATGLTQLGLEVQRADNVTIRLGETPHEQLVTAIGDLRDKELCPPVTAEALKEFKFADFLPKETATSVLTRRYADAASANQALRETVRGVYA